MMWVESNWEGGREGAAKLLDEEHPLNSTDPSLTSPSVYVIHSQPFLRPHCFVTLYDNVVYGSQQGSSALHKDSTQSCES